MNSKKERIASGIASMFTPSEPAPKEAAAEIAAPKQRAAGALPAPPSLPAKALPAPPTRQAQPTRPAAPAQAVIAPPVENFGGKLVASFKWPDGAKASAARPSDVPEGETAPISYKGETGRLAGLLPAATRADFLASCEIAARDGGATLYYINAKGGRERKYDRTGKRPSEIGIMQGWKRYSVTIRNTHYEELERMRQAYGLSHKDIVDAALTREFARMREELGKQRGEA